MNEITGIVVAKDYPKHLFETIASMDPLVHELIVADIGLDKQVIEKLKGNKKISIIPIKEPVPYVELLRENRNSA